MQVVPPAYSESSSGSTGGGSRRASAPSLSVRPATSYLAQARQHLAKAKELRSRNSLEAARQEFREAKSTAQAAIDAGELKQEAEGIIASSDRGLGALQF